MRDQNNFDQMVIETAANRLLLRAIIAHLIMADSERAERTIRSLQSTMDAMSSGAIKVRDMDPEVHRIAVDLVKRRAQAFLKDFSLAADEPQPA
jgi:hypothetical protein